MGETLNDVFNAITTAAGGHLKADSIVEWFKAAGIIDHSKIKDGDVKKAFDMQLIDHYLFQQGLQKLSQLTKVPVDDMTRKIMESKTKCLDQVKAYAEKALKGETESKVGKLLHKVEREMEAAAENIAHAAEAGISSIKQVIKK